MTKKINRLPVYLYNERLEIIKNLLGKGYKQADIARVLGTEESVIYLSIKNINQ